MTLHEEMKPVLHELVDRLLNVIPSHWTSAKLSVRRATDVAPPYEGFDHRISSDEQEAGEFPQPDDALFASTAALADVFRRHGQPWDIAEIEINWLEDSEKWESRTRFQYSEQVLSDLERRNQQ